MKANLVFKHFKECCNKIIQSDLVDKTIFKTHSLKITEPLWAEDNITGLFHYRLFHDLHSESIITIYPDNVLKMSNEWTKDEILLADATWTDMEEDHAGRNGNHTLCGLVQIFQHPHHIGELIMWFYHITSTENLPSILEHGLLPKIPAIDSDGYMTPSKIPMLQITVL